MPSIAGQYKQPITVQTKSLAAPGDRGQAVITWLNEATVRARVEDLSGRRLELARQLVATATHQITIRYLAGIKVTDRVVFQGRVFHIGAVLNKDNVNFRQELVCTEEVIGE